jgi:hypothetical protein
MHRPQRSFELAPRFDGLAHQAVKGLAAEKLAHKRPPADLTSAAKARRKEDQTWTIEHLMQEATAA